MEFIDIYHIDFRQIRLARDFELLDQSEQRMALGLRNIERRQSFIKSRALLRYLLSQYPGHEEANIYLTYNKYGKPALSSPGSLCFNLSHSGSLALIAISQTEVGIDLERVDSRVQYETVASLFFSQREQTCLNDSADNLKRDVFFDLWTRKEAYLKARGVGFSGSPELISVHAEDGIVEDYYESNNNTEWYVHSFLCQNGYRASVATSIKSPHVRHIDLTSKDSLKNRYFAVAGQAA